MSLIKNFRQAVFTCALLVPIAGASTIIQSSGNSQASVPLGYYPPYAQYGMTPIVYAVGWTQTSDYVDVNVFANLFTVGSPGTVDYKLVTALGSGTSFAADGVTQGTAATPTNPADVLLFHLNSLKAGTYYLVLDSPVLTGWQYNNPFQANDSMNTGVTFLGNQWSYGTSINPGYTAGSIYSTANFPVEFSVQGTAAAPEPATFAGTGLALLAVSMAMRKLTRRG